MTDTRLRTPRAVAFGKLLLNETRLAWRIPTGLASGLGLPLLLLVVFGSIPAMRHRQSYFGGVSYFAHSFPILVALTVLTLSIMVLPRCLIAYRQTGILRRLFVTPVPPTWLLAAQIVLNLAIALSGLVILTVAGVTAFGLELPRNVPGFLLAYLLTVTSVFAVGLCIAAIVNNDSVAQAIGGVLMVTLLFFGGLWIPRELMPAALITISDWTPLGASADALQRAVQGAFPSPESLLVLTVYTLVLVFLAVRYFRWE